MTMNACAYSFFIFVIHSQLVHMPFVAICLKIKYFSICYFANNLVNHNSIFCFSSIFTESCKFVLYFDNEESHKFSLGENHIARKNEVFH